MQRRARRAVRSGLIVAAVLAVGGCADPDAAPVVAAATSAMTTAPVNTAPLTSSAAPTTVAPTTPAPSTAAPTTAAPTTAAPTTAVPTTATPRAAGLTVTTGDSAYGEMLFDASGQAIYLFDAETTPQPQCYDACAVAWPPVLTDGPPAAAGGTREALLGTTTRADGSRQVTYAGHPLYYYVDDGKYEVLCHDVVEFGGRWLVLTPAGGPAPH